MKIERLHIRNFRCFESLTLDFGKRLTIILADNGAGKTAILDAVASGLGRYLTKLPGVAGQTTKELDLRIVGGERRAPYLILSWEARTHEGRVIEWSAFRRRDSGVSPGALRKLLSDEDVSLLAKGLREINEFTADLVAADAEGAPYILPVVAYYGTNRAIRDEVQRRRGFKKVFSRFDALVGALDADSRFRSAFEWFNAMEDVERRQQQSMRDFDYKHPELQVVRAAIERMLEGFKNPRTETRPLRFVIDRCFPDGSSKVLRIGQLSEGYRVVLGLTMDLARRLAEANGHIVDSDGGTKNPLELPGIVLIDEVELHLHPRWQQRIITDLLQTFPGTQFIITTHSPQVLSTVKRENVRVISEGANGETVVEPPLAMTYGEPSGDVMFSVMNVDPQPPVAEKEDLLRLTELIDQGQYSKPVAKRLMTKLLKLLGPQHPQLQRLNRSIRRQEAMQQ